MVHHAILPAALLAVLAAGVTHAQAKPAAPKFPPTGWQAVEFDATQRGQLRFRRAAHLTPKGVLELLLVRPEGWPETVVTLAEGTVAGRTDEKRLSLADREVGERYTIWLSRPDQRRHLELHRDFVRFPGKTFPGEGWRAHEHARLRLEGAGQRTPKTFAEAFEQPHRLTFEPGAHEHEVVYLLARLDAGGKDEVASQSLTGELPFWMHARRGEAFRVYALSPHDRTFRVTETLRVERDFPLRR